MNISGVVLARHAPNKANAMRLIEWLAGEQAQQMHADLNPEYPIRTGVAINPTVARYGTLNPDADADLSIAERVDGGGEPCRQGRFNN